MHFDALLVFTALAGDFSAFAFLTDAAFPVVCLSCALLLQLLFVQRPPITNEPHVQNSAKHITPLPITPNHYYNINYEILLKLGSIN
jgi:hypothetical protein